MKALTNKAIDEHTRLWADEIRGPAMGSEPLFSSRIDPEMLRRLVEQNRRVLNKLESHLGCVVCRGPLTDDGECEVCDA